MSRICRRAAILASPYRSVYPLFHNRPEWHWGLRRRRWVRESCHVTRSHVCHDTFQFAPWWLLYVSSVCLLCERNPLSKAHTLLFNFQFAHKFRRSKYTLMKTKACARCLSLTHAHTQCCTQDVFTRLSCTTFSLCIRTKVCIIYIHVPIYLHVYMYVNVYEYFYVYIYIHTYTYVYILVVHMYACTYLCIYCCRHVLLRFGRCYSAWAWTRVIIWWRSSAWRWPHYVSLFLLCNCTCNNRRSQ